MLEWEEYILDINKLKKKLDQLNQSGGHGNSNISYLNIKDGRNVLRILPGKNPDDDFFKDVFVHYGVGKSESDKRGKMVVCPTTNGEEEHCPVCELVKELYRLSGNDEKSSYYKQARALGRKKRVYYNAISRTDDLSRYSKNDDGKWINEKGEEESPIKVLATGIGIFKDLCNIIVDPEYGDITDPEIGLDVIITKSGTGFNTNYDVKTVRKESVIGFDGWKESLNDITVFANTKSYEDIEKLMDGGEDTDGEEESSPAPAPTATATKPATKPEVTADRPAPEPPAEVEGEDDNNLQAEIMAALKRNRK